MVHPVRALLVVLPLVLGACGGDSGTDSVPASSTPSTGTTAVTTDTWDSFAGAFMADYCVSCHDASPKDFTQYSEVVAWLDGIRCGVAATQQPDCEGQRPPMQFPIGTGAYPSDEERDRVVAWIEAGAPE